MNYTFSNRIASLQPSVIREIFKFAADKSVISLAAGSPAGETLPAQQILSLADSILTENPGLALQYGTTEGLPALRVAIKERMKAANNIGRDFDDIIITSGAQQVMDLAVKCLCNEDDTIICEAPSFIGSLNTFRAYRANLVGVSVDDDGINIEELENALKTNKNVRFIYTIPTFQNPSGITMSLEKRKAVYELANQYGVLILEDNPYSDLRTEGKALPCIKSFDENGIVIYAGTFSKILSPGLRVGYTIAPAQIISKMTVGKQTSDVHTPMLNQMLVEGWLKSTDLDAHISGLRAVYERKLNLMCDCLEKNAADFLTFKKPEGGMFVWCKLNEGIDMPKFCLDAVKGKVAVVPGSAFMVDESEKTQFIRLNFSTPSDENIVVGIERLCKIAEAKK
jgi:2-aminoadipate transaminase